MIRRMIRVMRLQRVDEDGVTEIIVKEGPRICKSAGMDLNETASVDLCHVVPAVYTKKEPTM